MFYVIENTNHIEQLFDQELDKEHDIFVHVVKSQPNTHICISNTVSLVYIFQLNTSKGYMLCIKHNETFSIDLDVVEQYLQRYKTIYCIDRPTILNTLPSLKPMLVDLSVTHWLKTNKRLELSLTTCHDFYTKIYGKVYMNINEIIPISKHYEILEEFKNKHIYSLISEYTNTDKNVYRYYILLQQLLNTIESNPIGVNNDILLENLNPTNPAFSIQENKLFTKYHFFTTTSRPQNVFNGINFNNLPKETNSRDTFIPLNDIFIEIDFNAYHVQLLSDLIGYTFESKTDIYNQLLDEYKKYDKKVETREDSKKITITQLYNGVYEKFKDIEFFKKLDVYTNELWVQYKETGIVNDPITGRNINFPLSETGKYKLLNYLLQSIETSNNIGILYTTLKSLSGLKSKLVLYNYDSLLIDTCREEFKEIINNIIPQITQNKYIINLSAGYTYGKLKKVK
jgi:hypothetical protein